MTYNTPVIDLILVYINRRPWYCFQAESFGHYLGHTPIFSIQSITARVYINTYDRPPFLTNWISSCLEFQQIWKFVKYDANSLMCLHETNVRTSKHQSSFENAILKRILHR